MTANRMDFSLLLLLLVMLACSPAIQAQSFVDLAASDANGGNFGWSTAISGNNVMIGAPFQTINGNPAQGEAYVKDCTNYPACTETKFIASDGAAGNIYGYSVSIDGTHVVVAAYGFNSGQGQVYLYDCFTPSTCETRVKASDGTSGDLFGSSVAISGSLMAVGAPHRIVNSNPSQGKVYLYDCSSFPTCVEYSLVASDGAASDQFGFSVAISGKIVVVGAYNKNQVQGKAYIYDCSNFPSSTCTEYGLIASDGAAGDMFGVSVAISGQMIAVGANGASTFQGATYLYDCRNGFGSCIEHKITASDGAPYGYFGNSVGVEGNVAIVGAPGKGQSYFYSCSTTPASCTETKLVNPDGLNTDFFGFSVSISGFLVVVGSSRYQGTTGAAYLYNGMNFFPFLFQYFVFFELMY